MNSCCWVFRTPTQQKENADVHKLHHSELFIHIGNFSLKFHKMCQTHRSEDTVLFMRWHGQITPILKLQHLFFSIWQPKKHLFYSPRLCSAPLWPAVIHTCRHWRDGNAHMEMFLCLKLVTVSRETYFCWGENEDRQKNPGEKQHWKTKDLHIWRIIIYTQLHLYRQRQLLQLKPSAWFQTAWRNLFSSLYQVFLQHIPISFFCYIQCVYGKKVMQTSNWRTEG